MRKIILQYNGKWHYPLFLGLVLHGMIHLYRIHGDLKIKPFSKHASSEAKFLTEKVSEYCNFVKTINNEYITR